MVSGGMTCVKYLLFLFNLIIFIVGLALVVVGAIVQTAYREYLAFFNGQINIAAIFIIVIGVIVFTVGFFGCCGAYKENHCMVITFAVLLGIIFFLEIAAAIAAFVLRFEVEKVVREKMANSTVNYEKKGVHEAWDQVQKHLECCGAGNYTDWNQTPAFNHTSVPQSCCINATQPTCGQDVIITGDVSNIYTSGCTAKLLEWSKDNIFILGGVALGFAFIQILGIIVACCLAGAIRKEYQPV